MKNRKVSLFVVFWMLFAASDLLAGENLVRVDQVHKVCMVNNQLFARDQIPVKVGENMYFGCCPNCKKTLTENAAMRESVDPVSGVVVDKAKAVIGANSEGNVYYFENYDNLKSYNSQLN